MSEEDAADADKVAPAAEAAEAAELLLGATKPPPAEDRAIVGRCSRSP